MAVFTEIIASSKFSKNEAHLNVSSRSEMRPRSLRVGPFASFACTECIHNHSRAQAKIACNSRLAPLRHKLRAEKQRRQSLL